MTEIKYKISGQNRRTIKKRRALLISINKNFWHLEDCERMYGGGMSDEDCQTYLDKNQREIDEINMKLKEQIG